MVVDPGTTAALNIGQQLIRDLLASRAKAKGTESEQRAEEQRLEVLTINLWGSILFEMRANCERVRFMIETAALGGFGFGTYDFSITEALLAEFASLVPQPIILAKMESVNAAIRRIDVFQRRGDPFGYGKAVAFAEDADRKKLYERFNAILELADRFGAACFEDGWAVMKPNVLPNAIVRGAPIDHGMI